MPDFSPWFSFQGGVAPVDVPAFVETDGFEWVASLSAFIDENRTELLKFCRDKQVQFERYFNAELTGENSEWLTFQLYFWGEEFPNRTSQLKNLQAVLQTIPNLSGCGFSILKGRSEIKPHVGETNTVFRTHFPIEVPNGEHGFTVNDEFRPWKINMPLMFNDGYIHSAFNKTSEDRILFIVDVIRPEATQKRKWYCCLGKGIIQSQQRIQNRSWIKSIAVRYYALKHYFKLTRTKNRVYWW